MTLCPNGRVLGISDRLRRHILHDMPFTMIVKLCKITQLRKRSLLCPNGRPYAQTVVLMPTEL